MFYRKLQECYGLILDPTWVKENPSMPLFLNYVLTCSDGRIIILQLYGVLHLWSCYSYSLLSSSLPPILGSFTLWDIFFQCIIPCSCFCLYFVPRLLHSHAISLSHPQYNQNKSPNHRFVDSFTFFHWTSVIRKHWSFGHCAKEQD